MAITAFGFMALGGALLIFLEFGKATNASATDQQFYSNDDGATWFADEAGKFTPFVKDGKSAYVAHVYTCDGGKTKFVLYLERYSSVAIKQIAADRAKGAKHDAFFYRQALRDAIEVKPPKAPESEWISQDAAKASKIIEPRCPDGRKTNVEAVLPP